MDNQEQVSITQIVIEKIKNGDIESFELLFKTYYKQLLQFAYRYLHDFETCKDVVQDVFFNIWKKTGNLDPKSNIKAYLFAAVRNQALKKIQKNKIDREYTALYFYLRDQEVEHIEDRIHLDEFDKEINKIISTLPEKGRMIFCMNRFDRLSYTEIAQILGISVKTVETHISRALKAIQPALLKLRKSF